MFLVFFTTKLSGQLIPLIVFSIIKLTTAISKKYSLCLSNCRKIMEPFQIVTEAFVKLRIELSDLVCEKAMTLNDDIGYPELG